MYIQHTVFIHSDDKGYPQFQALSTSNLMIGLNPVWISHQPGSLNAILTRNPQCHVNFSVHSSSLGFFLKCRF